KYLPPPYGITPPFSGLVSGAAQGNAFFFILPFLEQQNLYNQSLTNYQTWTNIPPNWTTVKIYNSTAVSARIELFVNPGDYSVLPGTQNPMSYSVNAAGLGYGTKFSFKNITDGSSNTIFFAEAIGECNSYGLIGTSFSGTTWTYTWGSNPTQVHWNIEYG